MADRNRIDMCKVLFDRLIQHAVQQGAGIGDALKGRFIRKLNDADAALMAGADVSKLIVTRQIKFVRISWNGDIYFSVFGLPEPEEELPVGLEPVDLTPGTFALSILESNALPIASASKIRDAIESDFIGADTEYDGHELDSIIQLFPKALLYKVSLNQEYHKSDYRALGSLLAKTYLDGPIQLNPNTISHLSDIFEGGSSFIPYKNLVQGILAIAWENLFLEIYRCIEQLYAAPKVKELREKWGSKLSLRELSSLLEMHLSWRPRENEALGQVICICDRETILTACTVLGGDVKGNLSDKNNLAARRIYDLRNRIVHYRPAQDEISKSDEEWNEIICVMLEIVHQVYERRGKEFFQGVPA